MKKVCFIVCHEVAIYNFRKEIVQRFLDEGVEVHILSPGGDKIDKLVSKGAIWHDVPVDRHGTSISGDLKLYKTYKAVLKQIRPDFVLAYTIKPNIYGGMAAGSLKIPFVVSITGLSSALVAGGKVATLIRALYKISLKKAKTVFFQNQANYQYFEDYNLLYDNAKMVPGSGVNLDEFVFDKMPEGEPIRFVYVARVMREKGIDEFLLAAKYIKAKYPQTEFLVCGFLEDDYKEILEIAQKEGTIIYKGMVDDIRTVLSDVHCIVHPSFYSEGISNAILEAITTGRAVITTDMPGCRELCVDGENGYIVPPQNVEALTCAIEKFLLLSKEEKQQMGIKGHNLAAEKFDRNIVVNAIMQEYEEVIK